MLSSHWIALLKKLPAEVHNQLSVTTIGGTEVNIQCILVMEGECLVFKGRLAASQDTGRLFYVPYDQIDYLGFTRSVSEEEFKAWYGESPAAAANGIAEKSSEHKGTGGRTPAPSRAALLERVRARTTAPGLSPPTASS
jgi:hypothetical protein